MARLVVHFDHDVTTVEVVTNLNVPLQLKNDPRTADNALVIELTRDAEIEISTLGDDADFTVVISGNEKEPAEGSVSIFAPQSAVFDTSALSDIIIPGLTPPAPQT